MLALAASHACGFGRVETEAARRPITHARHGATLQGRAHLRAKVRAGTKPAALDLITCLVHGLPQRNFPIDLVYHVLVQLVLLHDHVEALCRILKHICAGARVAPLVGLHKVLACPRRQDLSLVRLHLTASAMALRSSAAPRHGAAQLRRRALLAPLLL